jgi:Tfp pilus assembly PilM family ATPase
MGAITNLFSVILPHRLLVVVHIENMKTEKVLTQKDVELMERIVYKSADDIAVSIARSFERLEERMDAIESKTWCRLTDIGDEMGAELKALRLIVEGESEALIGEK